MQKDVSKNPNMPSQDLHITLVIFGVTLYLSTVWAILAAQLFFLAKATVDFGTVWCRSNRTFQEMLKCSVWPKVWWCKCYGSGQLCYLSDGNLQVRAAVCEQICKIYLISFLKGNILVSDVRAFRQKPSLKDQISWSSVCPNVSKDQSFLLCVVFFYPLCVF